MSNFRSRPTGLVLAPAQSQVVRFTDDSGNEIQISQADVIQYVCPNATAKEVVYFMELCRAQRLNPFIKEAFLVKYGNSAASIITGEVVFERRADAHPDFMGMESGVVFIDGNGQIQRREGTATYKAAGEVLIGGWARVHRRGRSDTYSEVSLDEYNKNQSVWKTMPGVMIHKCAKGVALRLAFPSDFQGMYLEEELGVAPNVTEVHAEVIADVSEEPQEPEYDPVPSMDELQDTFNSIVAELAAVRDADEGKVTLAILNSNKVKATGYTVGDDMTAEQLQAAIEQANVWLDKASEE